MTTFKMNKDKEDTMTEIYFDKNAVSIEKVHKKKIYARVVYKNGNENSFHIRTYQNTPYDPIGPYGKRGDYIDTKMKRVSKNTFDFYMMYLKTNNSIYMTKAQRGFLND